MQKELRLQPLEALLSKQKEIGGRKKQREERKKKKKYSELLQATLIENLG